eukprot:CAMPEP_0202908502 /NCGR_PEP_ID=MMETSP1392-20130828/46254_1 /ASSEMBLY_ACC=CAM_ASM_000868 /TAXON_ID=225041 /ORGANISM="Chlamydomonas chlamydogama, Strain SAG 11-48b" /LENGTH=193 /DNA_ID=CAMNT_0049597885 /DNA_START=160 /DNA_END=742 /DNA_ORIENTATION=+
MPVAANSVTPRTQNPDRRLRNVHVAAAGTSPSADDIVRVASVGDIVAVHFYCKDDEGQVLESSRDAGEPLTFEVGAGEMMGNKLFQGFDEAVRGLAVGQTTVLEASGGEWKRELLFAVPRDHPEVQRLEGRYKNQGGLQRGLLVELANGAMAMVLEVSEEGVKIDANNMLAGKKLVFELEVVSIDTAPVEEEA